jgi:predicted nucleic acid-binding protein
MNNKIFIDSSVLVEYHKGNNLPFLDAMLADKSCQMFISQAVTSEYLYHHLGIVGGKSPLAIKMGRDIEQVFQARSPRPFLNLFSWLPDDASMLGSAIELMSKYNFLPNDALILAAIRLHGIPALASLDPDFSVPCRAEGIHLLQTPADFEAFKAAL